MPTGIRGSQPRSFLAAHALRDSRSADRSRAEHTGETYDLVVIGGADAAAGPHTDAALLTAHRAVEQVLSQRAFPFVRQNAKA